MNLKGSLCDLSSPKVMGILNVTPDSFYDGGRHNAIDSVLKRVELMMKEGVDILDVGGYSTRPNAPEVSVEEELNRVLPAIEQVHAHFPDLPISIDSFRAEVAKQAVEAGASMVNDVSGGNLDEDMFHTVASLQVPYVLMHMRGNPATMQQFTHYEDLMVDIVQELSEKLFKLKKLGVNDIIVDPGFGFSKTLEQNYEMLKKMTYFEVLECPLLIGVSRKSMIYKLLDSSADDALIGTAAINMMALQKGAKLLRVHDVKAAKDVVTIFNQMNS